MSIESIALPTRLPVQNVSSVVSPPTVAWPPKDGGEAVAMGCPNCGAQGDKPVLLVVSFATPDHPMRHARVLRCPSCTCAFYEQQLPPDYTEGAMLGRGRLTFYLQQGAGVSLITRPLCQLGNPAGNRYLEVGCGFGFGLDFAQRAKGWVGTGIDPGQVSAVGRGMLGVDIQLRYLEDDEPEFAGASDVVMASETIEHVRSPLGFARTLRRALRPGGILVLTTPDATDLRPSTAPAALVALLSPGLHLVFQNETSLKAVLLQAGFRHVSMSKDSYSLVAFASDTPLKIEQDQSRLRLAYLDYLEQRFGTFPPDHDLFLGFAGRALQEAVNDGDLDRADRVFPALQSACLARFGIDIATMTELPPEARTCSLERLSELVPLALGGILYTDSLRRLGRGEARNRLESRFLLAAEACDTQRRAMGELAMEDAMSEEFGWAARAEALLCAAARAAPDIADRVARMPAPSDAAKQKTLSARVVAVLTSAGDYRTARDLAEAAGLQYAAWANAEFSQPLTALERDTLFALAVLDAQPGGDFRRGRRRFARVRAAAVGTGHSSTVRWDLYWSAVRGEVKLARELDDSAAVDRLLDPAAHAAPLPDDIAGDAERDAAARLVTLVNAGLYHEARSLAGRFDAADWTNGYPGPRTVAEQDALYALAILDGRLDGDLLRSATRFAALRASLAGRRVEATELPSLYWSALRGEAEALVGLGRQTDLPRLLDPAAHPDVAAGKHVAELTERLDCQRLVDLVNAADYRPAQTVAARLAGARFLTEDAATLRDDERDALFALAILDQQPNGDPARAATRFATLRASLSNKPGQLPLYWSALRGEANALRTLGRFDDLDRLLVRQSHPDAAPPEDLASLRAELQARHFIDLVNAGRYAEAAPLAEAVREFITAAKSVGWSARHRDAAFCLAMLQSQPGGNRREAIALFHAVRETVAAPSELYWNALRGEVTALTEAGRGQEAHAVLDAATHSASDLPVDLAGMADRSTIETLVALVNEGRYSDAGVVARRLDQAPFAKEPFVLANDSERNALFALAVLDAQPDGDSARAQCRFAAVKSGLPPTSPLYWAAVRGEIGALNRSNRSDAAHASVLPELNEADVPPDIRALAEQSLRQRLVSLVSSGAYAEAGVIAARLVGAAFLKKMAKDLQPPERDALFSLAMLDLQPGGDPARARARFASVRASLAPANAASVLPELYWQALRGEVQALGDDMDAIGRLLDSSMHGAALPRDLAEAVHHSAARRLVSHVNAARYTEAAALANMLNHSDFADGAAETMAQGQRDAAFSLSMLDLQPGGDPERAIRRFAAVRANILAHRRPDEPISDLYWSALRGEVVALSGLSLEDEASAHLEAAVDVLGKAGDTIPDDLRSRLRDPARAPRGP